MTLCDFTHPPYKNEPNISPVIMIFPWVRWVSLVPCLILLILKLLFDTKLFHKISLLFFFFNQVTLPSDHVHNSFFFQSAQEAPRPRFSPFDFIPLHPVFGDDYLICQGGFLEYSKFEFFYE